MSFPAGTDPLPTSTAEARALQEKLRSRVRLTPLALRRVRLVAGADIAVCKTGGRLVGAVVVLGLPDLVTIEERTAVVPLTFPYVPGLLSFREIPAVLACLQKLRSPFDVLLCDGQGIAHPRRFGLASHLGVLLQTPTIGCAKSRLVGEHREVRAARGDQVPLRHEGRPVGCVLRTRAGVKPIFLSPGHLVDTRSSRRIVLACCSLYRLPEPTRRAHLLAGQAKKDLAASGQ